MTRTFLIRGMLVGLVAGVVAFLIAWLLGEGPLAAGIAFEADHELPDSGEPEMVSRAVQSTIGLATGTVIVGIALGGLFALAYAVAQGRCGGLGARGTALSVALGGFVALYLIPAVKYPPNPPGTSEPDTISERTEWYLAMVLISVVLVVGGVVLSRWLAPRLGSWNAAILCILGGIAVVATAYMLLPAVNETPPDFDSAVLWRFRLASSAVQLTLWTVIGLAFGVLTERELRSASISARRTHSILV